MIIIINDMDPRFEVELMNLINKYQASQGISGTNPGIISNGSNPQGTISILNSNVNRPDPGEGYYYDNYGVIQKIPKPKSDWIPCAACGDVYVGDGYPEIAPLAVIAGILLLGLL